MGAGQMSLGYLDEFLYLADSLNFRQTANHFYVSRSVVSRHIAALEELVGVRLFERGSRTVCLTEAGRVFYGEAKKLLLDWDIAIERVHNAEQNARSLIRIGYLRNAARPVLLQFASYMANAHPEYHLSMVCMEYTELRRAIEGHEVDVALAINVVPTLSRSYRSTPVYSDEFFVVCRSSHDLAQGDGSISIHDIDGQKLLVPGSYIQAGLGDVIGKLVDEETVSSPQPFYQDIDILQLKVLTEGYMALLSGRQVNGLGNEFTRLTIADVDTAFSVSSFYHGDFIGDAYAACCEGFEWCCTRLSGGEGA